MADAEWAKLFAKARRHLGKCDPVMKQLIAAVGPCTLTPGGDPFALLVRAIVSQLISTKAAMTISCRVVNATGTAGITPASIVTLGEEGLRPLGLSRAKAQAILDLATRARDGRLPLERLGELTDEEIATSLTAVKGIGVWTVEMFLIFNLGRTDVLPVKDLGLRAGVQRAYGLEGLPSGLQLRELAEPWRPYRSIATWYLWRSRGGVPQSE